MNIEEIKRNAPEGATHYKNSIMVWYYMLGKDFLYIWLGCIENLHWVKYISIEEISGVNIKPL